MRDNNTIYIKFTSDLQNVTHFAAYRGVVLLRFYLMKLCTSKNGLVMFE